MEEEGGSSGSELDSERRGFGLLLEDSGSVIKGVREVD